MQQARKPKVIFIYPSVGRYPETKYIRTWQMQPLGIAVLSGLTPNKWEKVFYDDRFEEINYDEKADLVAITTEAYTARRAYQIAVQFKQKGIRVIMGGFHATARPDEILEYADSVCVGEAESLWGSILEDAIKGKLKKRYKAKPDLPLKGIIPDRSIFQGKNYFKLALVETGRGCNYHCTFCSIASFYKSSYRQRPVDEIIEEIKGLREKVIFFIDDNIVGNMAQAKKLFKAMIGLNVGWITQASINIASDPDLLKLMKKSGCIGILIGFESLSKKNLKSFDKAVNVSVDFSQALETIREHGLLIYGTFVFGMEDDTPEFMQETVEFAVREKMFIGAFAHVVPFPGTALYERMKKEGRLLDDTWWLSSTFRFGDIVYKPYAMDAERLEEESFKAKKVFYSFSSIFRRSADFKANLSSLKKTVVFFGLNLLMKKEVSQRKGLPLGRIHYDEPEINKTKKEAAYGSHGKVDAC